MSQSKLLTEDVHDFKRVKTSSNAARFIDHVGFCLLFPVKDVRLPSLYFAMGRRWPPRWDDDAKKLWRWKDELPKKRQAFYGKYFKGRGTFLSLECLALLLATHETAVDAEQAEAVYECGRISRDALEVWLVLGKLGALATLELRHACKMESQAGNKRFKKAILELQSLLIVTHSGAEQETEAWASNRFELVRRAFPKHTEEARRINSETARRALAAKYRALYPDASPMQIARLFRWSKGQATYALAL